MARTRWTKVLGGAAQFALGLYMCGALVCGTYYNWQYARENGFVKWLFLGEVVPTCKAFIWPYYVFFPKAGAASESLRHLRKSIDYSNEAAALTERADPSVKDSEIREIASLAHRALDEAKLVDADVLGGKYGGFASSFQGQYIKGLQLLIEGCEEDDRSKLLEGQTLLNEWGDWYESNMRGHTPKESASRAHPAPEEATPDQPPLSADELERYSRVLSKVDKEPLTEADLAEVRAVMESYTKRTGNRLTSEQYDLTMGVLKLSADYMYELGQSLLLSWDRKERFTTTGYERLSIQIAEFGGRSREKLATDNACLEAASRNQAYVEDQRGDRYEFGRDVILQKIRETELLRENTEKMAGLWEEFVE